MDRANAHTRVIGLSVLVLLVAVAAGCRRAGTAEQQPIGADPDAGSRDAGLAGDSGVLNTLGLMKPVAARALHPSLIQLIAAPDRFRGAKIGASGYFIPDGEPPDGILFLDRESAEMGFLQNAIHVRFGKCRYVPNASNMVYTQEGRDLQAGYVFLRGVFEPSLLDDPWRYAGEICSVTFVNRLPAPRPRTDPVKSAKPGGGQRHGTAVTPERNN